MMLMGIVTIYYCLWHCMLWLWGQLKKCMDWLNQWCNYFLLCWVLLFIALLGLPYVVLYVTVRYRRCYSFKSDGATVSFVFTFANVV